MCSYQQVLLFHVDIYQLAKHQNVHVFVFADLVHPIQYRYSLIVTNLDGLHVNFIVLSKD